MKVTETYQNREEFIELLREHDACEDEFEALLATDNEDDWMNVILRNFYFCVIKGILEEWLPDELPNCKVLNCSYCRSLESLPELPKCEVLNCDLCLSLKSLPELPNCERLYCNGCLSLESLPELPNCERLYCNGCPNLKEK